ncbi:hypothetical protein [Streptomyces sp. CBMA123]|uniref:hypothetical protein n=1 Tax=Streptomyces sp. CBMA123 TaxID=1896313 RepID=UPI001661DD60|nr:hypothetical protein [Streptomyces sp. CBMA123]MBD0691023.1 hypothetical protein [Streptomyces sp. CBMA123]
MTMDPVLVRRGFAAVAPHGPVVTEYVHRHLFEHDPALRGLFAEHLEKHRDRLFARLTHYAGDAWTPQAEAARTAVYAVVGDTRGAALTDARSA